MAGLLDALKQYIADAAPGGLLNSEVPTAHNMLSGLLSNSQPMPTISGMLSGVDNIKRVTALRLADLMNNPKDYLSQTLAQMPQTIAEQGAGMAPVGITAWHGSPHKFDKFSLDKIGTGEGAQAYGHGLYLAESPQVATEYQRKLAGADNGMAGQIAASKLQMYKTPEAAISALQEGITPNLSAEAKAVSQSAIDLLKQGKADTGNLYKTDIPDEAVARFLDWDKPLSQQAPEVQSFAKSVGADLDKAYGGRGADGQNLIKLLANQAVQKGHIGPSGEYVSLPSKFNEYATASKALKEAGIPGIRYLDGGSRAAGQGSSNFVAFDPELIRILERNGQPTGQVPWKPGEWK